MMLSSKGSSDTCISEMLAHIPSCCFHSATSALGTFPSPYDLRTGPGSISNEISGLIGASPPIYPREVVVRGMQMRHPSNLLPAPPLVTCLSVLRRRVTGS
jgi:hypothetical protein